MANQASAELFLDILTKEEKEALLSKKMEEIRKKNEALRKRHEEIQKDKKVADQLMKPPSPTDSSITTSNKDRQTHPNDRNFQDKPKKNKPAGRGKPRPKSGGDFNHVQDMHITRSPEARSIQLKDNNDRFQKDEINFRHDTPKRFSFGETDRPKDFRFGEHDDRDADNDSRNQNYDRKGGNYRGRGRGGRGGSDHYKENRGDQYNRQDSRSSNEEYYDKREFRNSGDFSRQDSRGRGRGRNDHYNRQDSRNSNEDFHDKRDFRNSGDFSRRDSRGRGGQYNRQGSRDNGNRYSGEFRNKNNYNKEKREQFEDSEFEPTRKRPHGGSQNYHDDNPEGPPPDPSYNFLSDRSREGPHSQERSDRREPPRRHPKNFGGQDFSNVKNQMKNVKERQQHRQGPPKSKMEMAVTMTGKERRQYIEWKADRDRVDNARIERQKSSSGEWKREWDKEKIETEEIKQTEPAKRQAGRIGSGRFDRGDKDERQKVHPEETPRSPDKVRHHPDSPTKGRGEAPLRGRGKPHAEMPPRMVGRGRGRGRGKAKSANEAKPQRVRSTSSGDERVVNCDSDLLVIKLENTPGDNSVEVEYSDGEIPVGKSPRGKQGGGTGGTATHGAQTEELWWDEDDDLTMSLIQDGMEGDDALEHRQLFDDADHHDIVVEDDEDEWEDCDDDSFYSTEKSQNSTDSREGQLHINTQLNPDAPEFTPTSPLSPASPKERRPKKHDEQNKSGQNKGHNKASGNKNIVSPQPDKQTNKVRSSNEKVSKATDNNVAQKGTDKKNCDVNGQAIIVNVDKISNDINGQKAMKDTDVSKDVKIQSQDGIDTKISNDETGSQDGNVKNDTKVSKGSEGPQDGDHVEVDSSPSVESEILQNSSSTEQKAHSETARDGDVDNTESVVVDGGEVVPSFSNVGESELTDKVNSDADTPAQADRGADDTTLKDLGVSEDTINDDSCGKDGADDTTTTVVGAEDFTTTDGSITEVSCVKDAADDSTTEQMANTETKTDVKKLDDSSRDDKKESDD